MKDIRNTTIRLPPGVIAAIDDAASGERMKHPGRTISRNSLISEALVSRFGSRALQPVSKTTEGVPDDD